MTVTDVRTLLKNVVEAHATHNTFYSIWSVAKDRASELEYPCVIWDQWRSRLVDDPQGYLHRSVLIRLLIITSVPTDRTPLERDQAVEAADNAASDIVLKIREDYRDLELSNISTTTMFDEYTQLETGVLLTFTLMGDGLCLDQNQFPGTNCPTFAELISTLSWPQIKSDMSDAQIAEATEDLGGDCPDATARMVDSLDTELDSQTVAPGGTVTLVAPDVLILQSNSEPGIPVGTTPAGSVYPLPMSVIQYEEDGGGITYTEDYDTLFIGPQITPSRTIPARDLLNTADEVVGDRKITLADLINNTVPQCPVPDPCDPLTVTLAGVEIVNEADPCGVDVVLECTDLVDAVWVEGAGTESVNGLWTYGGIGPEEGKPYYIKPDAYADAAIIHAEGVWNFDTYPFTGSQLYNESGGAENRPWDVVSWTVLDGDAPAPTVRQATIADICGGGDCPACEDVTIQLQDSGGVNIGSPVSVPSGTSANITAPDGTVTVRNLNGTALGSPSVKSNGTANYTAPIPIKMGWGAGDADTLEWTVTDAEAGTYNSYTQDGGSGTITYSKNGAAFAALSGTITLAVGNTIKVRRTTTTNAGYSTWAP